MGHAYQLDLPLIMRIYDVFSLDKLWPSSRWSLARSNPGATGANSDQWWWEVGGRTSVGFMSTLQETAVLSKIGWVWWRPDLVSSIKFY